MLVTEKKPRSAKKKAPAKKRVAKPRPSIGWREWVALPELGVDALESEG